MNTIELGIRQMIESTGVQWHEGLDDTPKRVMKAFAEMTSGYSMDPAQILARTFPGENYDELVIVPGIQFVSLCEHHLLPFTGSVVVAYIPRDRVIGLSKLPRLVECFARRLQVQERMTVQIADAIDEHLKPRGVGVVVRAKHACMTCRGVRQPEAEMVTSVMRGALRDKPEARAELMGLK